MKHFIGLRQAKVMYSDNSGEIKKASKDLQILPQTSQPGMPANNAVAERTNQDILGGVRTNLEQAGLPACFWPYAAEHYCVMDNTSHASLARSGGALTWVPSGVQTQSYQEYGGPQDGGRYRRRDLCWV